MEKYHNRNEITFRESHLYLDLYIGTWKTG